MTTYWLRGVLERSYGVEVGGTNTILTVRFSGKEENVYYPNPNDYIITADVVKTAKDQGATIIVYAQSWSEPTLEAKMYAKELKISIMRNAQFFAYLRSKGVVISQ
jgi:hypothetical protein